jgi:hypothetical protein
MPKGPKGQKRPADVIASAVTVMRIATGDIEERTSGEGKNPAAVELGRKGGLKGGKARAANMTKKERSEAARKAASTRWRRSRPA